MQKRWLGLVLVAHVGCCLGLTPAEENFVNLLVAANRVDRIFASGSFATNAKEPVRKMAEKAVDEFLSLINSAKGARLPAALAELKKDGVLSNWAGAVVYNWVKNGDARPETKKAIGNIMTIYAGNAKSVLTNKVARLISDDYLALKELAAKIDELLTSSKFGTNADMDTKLKVRVAMDNFREWCKTYEGLAADPLKSLVTQELFALWDMATNKTGWLDVERTGWNAWAKDPSKKEAYKAVTAAIGRIMAMYIKNKKLLADQIDAIFAQVRDVLVTYAKIEILDTQMRNRADEDTLINEDMVVVEKVLTAAKNVDNKLGKMSMNSSYTDKIGADVAVDEFKEACEGNSAVVLFEPIKNLASTPIVTSWAAVKELDGWFAMNGADKTVFDNWKKAYSAAYKAFSKTAQFMDAYTKSKTALQNLVKGVVAKTKGGDVKKDIEKLNKEKLALREKTVQMTDKLSRWTVPTFKLPVIAETLLPGDTPTTGETGEAGEKLGGEEGYALSQPIDNFARALKELMVAKK